MSESSNASPAAAPDPSSGGAGKPAAGVGVPVKSGPIPTGRKFGDGGEHITLDLGRQPSAEGVEAQKEVALGREGDRADISDRDAARAWLQKTFGNEAGPSFRLMKAYVANMSLAERQKLMSERNADGVHALNDPVRLRELITLARGGGVAAPKMTPAEERAQIEALMADRYSRYWKGPDAERLQARWRDLLRGV